ncbi:MAG: uL15 family ribosomal protein [bacterium]|nr:uL15 family ribosomal protein [bacterium]
MQINNIIPRTKNKKTMIVGRGGKRGKTSGRGGKGQTARAGNKKRPELRDFIKRIPKLRGRGKNSQKSFAVKPLAINLDFIEKIFSDGEVVSEKTLIEKKGIATIEGKIPHVKILSVGELTKKLSFEGCKVSKEAMIKIEKAGGTVK